MNQQPPGRPPTPRPHDYLRDDDLHTVKRYYLRLQRATIAAIVTFFAIALVTEFTNHSLHQRFVLLTSAMACCSITAWLSWTIQRLLRTLMLFATLGIVLRNPPAAPHYLLTTWTALYVSDEDHDLWTVYRDAITAALPHTPHPAMTKLGAEGLALTSLVLVVLHQLLPDPSPAWLIPLLTPALVAALIRTA